MRHSCRTLPTLFSADNFKIAHYRNPNTIAPLTMLSEHLTIHIVEKLTMSTLYLVDGSGYIFRAFYAIGPLSNSSGFPTNALYGFTRMLIKLLRDVKAENIAVAFDTGAPTFRHEMYDQYKANREECPSELVPQLPLFRDVVRAFGIVSLEKEGFEADDIIATIAQVFTREKHPIVIVSGDKDLAQLVTDEVEVWDAMRDVHFTPAGVRDKFGVTPAQIIDYLTLVGDTSDNVPGVRGIGPKTAAQLLGHFGTLDNLLADLTKIDEIKGLRGATGIREKLDSNRDMIKLSRELVTLDSTVAPFSSMTALDQFTWKGLQKELAEPLFKQLEFDTLLAGLVADSAASAKLSDKAFVLVTPESWSSFLEQLKGQKEFAFDTETSSLDPHAAEIVGMSFSWAKGQAFYLPLSGSAGKEKQLDPETVHRALRPIFQDPAIKKIAFNAKFDINIVRSAGYEVSGLVFDPMLASYVLNPDKRQHGLSALAQLYLHEQMKEYDDLVGDRESIGDVPIEEVKDYAAHDAEATWSLRAKLDPLLGPPEEAESPSLRRVYEKLELPLVTVLAEMEWTGIRLDVEFLTELDDEFQRDLARLEQGIYSHAGTEFNLNSPRQLAQILYERLQIPTAGVRRNQTALSTDASVLARLAPHHPIVAEILEYREVFKLRSTYVEALRRMINPKTARIHTSFNQTVAATGRLSSNEPNLQNIPIRTERGRRLRKAFIADEGYQLLSADYSQIELRVLAHLSGDKNLQRAFLEGADIHTTTAKEIFGAIVGSAGEAEKLRRIAKTINFGVIYGMGAFRLAESLGVSRKQAQQYIDNYFARYPRVRAYFDELTQRAAEVGYVETLFGRRRFMRDIDTSGRDQGYATRSLHNAPLQGSAADIIKLAMIRVHEKLKQFRGDARLLLQVHDELVVEVKDDIAPQVMELVKKEMEGAVQLAVPLVADACLAKTWE